MPSPLLQSVITGASKEEFAEVTELEGIFTQVHELVGLEKLPNLRSICCTSPWSVQQRGSVRRSHVRVVFGCSQ